MKTHHFWWVDEGTLELQFQGHESYLKDITRSYAHIFKRIAHPWFGAARPDSCGGLSRSGLAADFAIENHGGVLNCDLGLGEP